ncbi:PREDICTED: transmembrane protein 256 homolog [Eufriesea mexicana]|uniref:transmembrane protein 256 homolog n=1 Tax=Eufriesea mexicana TaxID=516756 RepID=UPI00083C30ED|nr:PREDICTED: transmembrane protein 256 homolog [Eufriesea mexicana]
MFQYFVSPLTLVGESASIIYRSCTAVPQYLGLTTNAKIMPSVPLWKLAAANGPFVRIAALSGATAVILGAYGSHKEYSMHEKENCKQVFETGSRYHFIHTLALLGLPLCRAPYMAATFLLSGIILFSGTCYYYGITGNKQLNKLTPLGGVCFILGWLSMCI